jgi:hypothetical protein
VGQETAALSARGGTGSLDLKNRTGSTVVSVSADTSQSTHIDVTKPTAGTQVTVGTSANGGRTQVFHNQNNEQVVTAEAAVGGGRVELATHRGETTCELSADDAALVLSGTAEDNQNDRTDPNWGGGEVVLADYAPSRQQPDIRVHLKGEHGSAYGVDANNRPRINVDGATATLEIGRDSLGPDREGVDGTLRLLEDEAGKTVLAMRVEREVTRSQPFPGGELVLNWVTSQGQQEQRGKIQAHPDGLMIYDAGDNPAMLIEKRGTIKTRRQISENVSL